ncbi:RagB/SusD family nutrient uptake outer membrane protein [Mariniflexile sp. AS56]|uniref:RagB/SusD family nutrient uptake outer membrane protein n=1 Tax=Mariniflexile sp. AS56 TaxID=3063957 RepID=UPI0026EEBC51|nr:RagB/SusD family nutrient uptake outer membrane protein [Mariniflexile sp. AS56]MDO7173168.1 RagB/SusD family nutrient uptake outer membrane protein [Mariniflexile sp. AS56]
MKLFNNINRYIKYGFSILIVAMLFVSCTDDLDSKAYGEPVLEDFYKNPAQAEQALIAAYSSMSEIAGSDFWGTMGNDVIFGEIGTDDFIKGGRTAENNAPLFERDNWAITTSNPIIEQMWKINYKGILFANLVIENVPNISFEDEVRKKEILAEAHFLRAFYYFDLVNSFGGVPIISKPLKIGEFNVPRATKEDSYKLIEDDLKIAIADLPSRLDRDASYTGRADKGAALGMMMRVSLYQNKMGQVETYGNQLFALGHELTPDYATIFQPEGEWNIGSLFEINFSSDASILGTGIPKRVNPNSNRGGGFVQARVDLRNEYETNDPRFGATLFFKDAPYGTDWYVRKYAWAPYTNYEIPTIGGDNNSANNIRIIRLADAYLMYAEAIYNTDPTKAIEYVNKVRTRARGTALPTVVPNLPDTLSGQPLLDAIYHERRVELAGEGFRFHDLVRTGRAEALLSPYGFVKGTHELMPLPVGQVTLSEGVLVQNPNY